MVDWVGEGKPVTPKGALRPVDVAVVGTALGVTVRIGFVRPRTSRRDAPKEDCFPGCARDATPFDLAAINETVVRSCTAVNVFRRGRSALC